MTLPLTLARERDRGLAEMDLRAAATPARAEEICERVVATGVLDDARERALSVVAEAKAGLPELDDRRHRALELVADGVVERYA